MHESGVGDSGVIEIERLQFIEALEVGESGQACRESDKTLSALLNGSCEVKSIEDDRVVLGFYHTFHLERAESPPNAAKLKDLFSRVLGRPVGVVFEHAPRPRAETPPRAGHLVQVARELGATPVEDRTAGKGDADG